MVRTFGSKENLFAEASERAINLIKDTFIRAAQKTKGSDTKASMGHAYIELMADRSNLLIVMHLFTMGQHPRFGPIARTGFLEIYRVINDALNMGTEAAKDFLALGMLINVLLGIRLVEVSSAKWTQKRRRSVQTHPRHFPRRHRSSFWLPASRQQEQRDLNPAPPQP